MKITIRGCTYNGADFEEEHDFDYTFELFQILRTIYEHADQFHVWLTPDVNAAEAEPIMAAAIGGSWEQGVCSGGAFSLTRLSGTGGRA